MSVSRRQFIHCISAAGLTLSCADRNSWAIGKGKAEDSEIEIPHTLNPVPIQAVVIDDDFWSPKRKVWQEVTIRDCFRKFESDRGGALNNFDKVSAGLRGGHAGDPWMDGLIYEMIRGASDFLISHPDPELERQLDGYVDRIAAAAAKDARGYINTYTQLVEPGHDWGLKGGLQIWQHEIYNLGALIDAGIHYYRATGKTALLESGVKIANYMYDFMGPAPKKNIVPCHPLPEEALVRLYELFHEQPTLKEKVGLPVNETNYLRLSQFWIENRGNNIGKPDWEKNRQAAEQFVRNQEYGDGRPSWGRYAQDDVPVFEQKEIEGHAVRATLLCAGIAAAYRVNNDSRYGDTSVRLWENMVYKRMHVTGGVGAYAQEEKFGPDYTLPNDAYLETCAAVGAGFFHQNMNSAFGHARYVDELERTLYNGALAGVSLKGDTYFYENPLEGTTKRTRWVWHECPCCPPMFIKFMGAMPSYIYATDHESVYVNLFVGSRATIKVQDAQMILKQTTQYPWDGAIRIDVEAAPTESTKLMLRVPGWCRGESLTVNGKRIATDQRVRGYVQIDRPWRRGDVVALTLPMPIRKVRANLAVKADIGRVALMRGPIVYCLESADNAGSTQNIAIKDASLDAQVRHDLMGGL
ncbi:MAG TPA: beta-L-arabinofuranosidase domain-containing protein, partial [Edaphobacter sp.]|nr:beta-L-arabinofuranosidase domain-containing protein [Edaphobacter sp.]